MKNKVSDKNEQELLKLLQDKREELRSFRFNISGTKIKNVKLAKNTKKHIARILTSLTKSGNK